MKLYPKHGILDNQSTLHGNGINVNCRDASLLCSNDFLPCKLWLTAFR
jgi:hypothetical protein